nr:2-isopropylmalate synthase [Halovenus rubra]
MYRCLWLTTRIRRRPRRIEFFQGTTTNSLSQDVRIFDTTLRDGEQTPRTSFSYENKRQIAAQLDEMGTHVIEAGFPVNSDDEFEAVRDIAAATSTTVCGLARVVENDIEAALDSGVDMVHVFVSTSDVQLEDSMHATRTEAKQQAVESITRVVEAGAECMFSPMDATRTDEEFLSDIVNAAADAGADWINVPDTCGVSTPERFQALVADVVDASGDARVDVHTHDDFGLATPNALAGYRGGASQAQVSVNGIGERAGNAAYEEVVMGLESLYDVDTGIDTTQIADLSKTVEEQSAVPVPGNKPVVGDNAFAHESGIHAAGVIENSETFEPGVMTPDMVGAEREFVLGKHTGTHSVRKRLEDVGFEPTDEEVRSVTQKVKESGVSAGHVTDTDLERFAHEVDITRHEEVRV